MKNNIHLILSFILFIILKSSVQAAFGDHPSSLQSSLKSPHIIYLPEECKGWPNVANLLKKQGHEFYPTKSELKVSIFDHKIPFVLINMDLSLGLGSSKEVYLGRFVSEVLGKRKCEFVAVSKGIDSEASKFKGLLHFHNSAPKSIKKRLLDIYHVLKTHPTNEEYLILSKFFSADLTMLPSFLIKEKKFYPFTSQCITDILSGLEDLHQLNYGHGDIKPKNIFYRQRHQQPPRPLPVPLGHTPRPTPEKYKAFECVIGDLDTIEEMPGQIAYSYTPLYRSVLYYKNRFLGNPITNRIIKQFDHLAMFLSITEFYGNLFEINNPQLKDYVEILKKFIGEINYYGFRYLKDSQKNLLKQRHPTLTDDEIQKQTLISWEFQEKKYSHIILHKLENIFQSCKDKSFKHLDKCLTLTLPIIKKLEALIDPCKKD